MGFAGGLVGTQKSLTSDLGVRCFFCTTVVDRFTFGRAANQDEIICILRQTEISTSNRGIPVVPGRAKRRKKAAGIRSLVSPTSRTGCAGNKLRVWLSNLSCGEAKKSA